MFGSVSTFFKIQFGRHLRSPALWIVLLGAIIGARYMVPLPDANYVTLAVNNAYPVQTSAIMGMQLGIVTALILTPLAYIFLRAGPTRRQPWQIEDVTPSNRMAMTIGQGAADTAILWVAMLFLAVAGIILSVFRLPIEEVKPFHTLLTFVLIAGPALAFIAALRTLFNARPWLRGAWGDFLFFVIWMAGVVIAAMSFSEGGSSPFTDVFGYAAAIDGATDEPISSAVIGGAPATEDYINLDALAGTTNTLFLMSRLMWLGVAGLLFVLSALIFKPRKFKQKIRGGMLKKLTPGLDKVGGIVANPLVTISNVFGNPIRSSFNQLLKPRYWALILLVLAVTGGALPFRPGTGGAIMLVLILVMSRQSGVWQAPALRQFMRTLPAQKWSRLFYEIAAAMLLAFLVCLPAILRAVLNGNIGEILPDFVFIIGIMPVAIYVLGYLTRTGLTGRLIFLFIWYGYLNL